MKVTYPLSSGTHGMRLLLDRLLLLIHAPLLRGQLTHPLYETPGQGSILLLLVGGVSEELLIVDLGFFDLLGWLRLLSGDTTDLLGEVCDAFDC